MDDVREAPADQRARHVREAPPLVSRLRLDRFVLATRDGRRQAHRRRESGCISLRHTASPYHARPGAADCITLPRLAAQAGTPPPQAPPSPPTTDPPSPRNP